MIRYIALVLLLCPTSASAFFVETTYASGEVPVQPVHRAASSAFSSKALSILQQEPTSGAVPVVPPVSSESFVSSKSFSSLASFRSSVSSIVSKSTVQNDEEILRGIYEFSNEEKTLSEQLEQLTKGFSITSTSTMGSPLPASQREAILRAKISTLDQLKLFTKALIETDDSLRKFVVTDESVTMTYRAQGYLLGFSPLSYLVTVTVHFDGTVDIDGPWWLLIAKDSIGPLENEFDTTLPSLLSGIGSAQDAEMFTAIATLLQVMHDSVESTM